MGTKLQSQELDFQGHNGGLFLPNTISRPFNCSCDLQYACRKTLADSRPRVTGRFAKNDELGEAARTASSNHEEDTDEDVMVKEEVMVDTSDIFAHISGVNSFKCNYPIQSWI
ncbi:zinc finger CONSTANS-LIKE 11 [Olea europaea subsp. europaea]|uniref:Zinc finger CONSTANS-LIKE 11 n=1 Tax=Olea europaea subsp. europaea TaxID=158383 RepID=A0A8S0UZV2_OLEEU|nr:zinc finger CONSTANS-LIKE 11 [Olea europaea subsp. europaea]